MESISQIDTALLLYNSKEGLIEDKIIFSDFKFIFEI